VSKRKLRRKVHCAKCPWKVSTDPNEQGDWVGFVEVRAFEVLKEALRIERETCDRYRAEEDRLRGTLEIIVGGSAADQPLSTWYQKLAYEALSKRK
jgi:hypothetical protein